MHDVMEAGARVMSVLQGKVAIVTGGTSGIGARIAALFVEEGARIVIAGRRRERGEQLARSLGQAAVFVRTDVTVEADVKAVVGSAVTRFDRLDCLINNAGIGSQRVSIPDVDLEHFDAAIAVHLRAVLAGMKYVGPTEGRQHYQRGKHQRDPGRPGRTYYSVAKAATIHLTRCAAVELGEKGIRVNTISPGPIATGIFGKGAGLQPEQADENPGYAEAAIAAVLPRWQPLPYVGRTDDIAQAALFLAGDASRLVTGHNLVVDGGISAGWPIAVAREDIALFGRTLRASR